MTNSAKVGGIAIILFALLYLASFIFASPIVGLEDGDNPAVSLEFLRQHSDFYFLSGLASVIAAITLTAAALSIADTVLQPASSLLIRTTSTFGLFTAAFLFGHGVLHIQSPGTLLYMEGLSRDWGLVRLTCRPDCRHSGACLSWYLRLQHLGDWPKSRGMA